MNISGKKGKHVHTIENSDPKSYIKNLKEKWITTSKGMNSV